MQLDTKQSAYTPSARPTTPLRAARAPLVVEKPTLWRRAIEYLRNEGGYVAVTVGLDIWAGFLSVSLAHAWLNQIDTRGTYTWSWVFIPILIAILATRGLYKRRLGDRFLDEFEPVETSAAVAALLALAVIVAVIPPIPVGEVAPPYVRPSELMLKIWICAAVLVPAVRFCRSLTQRYLRRKYRFGKRAIIVGSGPIAHQIITRMQQVPDYGLRPVGIIDDTRPAAVETEGVPYLGTTDNLERAVVTSGAEKLIIAHSSVPDEQLSALAQRAHHLGMKVRVVPRMMDAVGVGATIEHMGGIPLMVLAHTNRLAVRAQAHDGPHVRLRRATADLPAVPDADAAGAAQLAGSDLLRAGPYRPRRQGVPVPEVPQHAAGRPRRGSLPGQGRVGARRCRR